MVLLGSFVVAYSARGDVRDTKHNLVRSAKNDRAVDSKEVCVFCHFPSVAGVDLRGRNSAPKWQPSVIAGYTFPIYDNAGRLDVEGSDAIGSPSVACLSCHDSTQANSISRLSMSHPYGVPYRGARGARRDGRGAKPRRRESTTVSDSSRAAVAMLGSDDFRPPNEALMEGRRIYWTSAAGASYQRGKHDLPLFVRRDRDESGDEVAYIECASCHDPHSTSRLFLRIPDGSARLCLSCHDK